MTNRSLKIQVPGKLMVAGEYAVLEKHQPLIAIAVNRYVKVTIEDSKTNELNLVDFALFNLAFTFNEDSETITLKTDDSRVDFVRAALQLSYTYLREHNIKPTPLLITIKSELDDVTSGKKYGLGSSAAVTTAVVRAVLTKFLQEKVTDKLVFKLAVIAHMLVQGNGSGADVAASAYGGCIQYKSPQVDWVIEQYQASTTLTKLLNKDWKYLKIKRLPFKNLHMCVGWTQKKASTKDFVRKIEKAKHLKRDFYEEFIAQSAEAVQLVASGLRAEDYKIFAKGIQLNREAFHHLEKLADVKIETEELKKLCDLAESYSGFAKFSGAGGGDCGIAFMPNKASCKKLQRAWEKAGIIPLDLTIANSTNDFVI